MSEQVKTPDKGGVATESPDSQESGSEHTPVPDVEEAAFQSTLNAWEAKPKREQNILSVRRFFFHSGYAYNSNQETIRLLVDALKALEPYLTTRIEMLDYASLNEGRTSGYDVASLKAREALAAAEKET